MENEENIKGLPPEVVASQARQENTSTKNEALLDAIAAMQGMQEVGRPLLASTGLIAPASDYGAPTDSKDLARLFSDHLNAQDVQKVADWFTKGEKGLRPVIRLARLINNAGMEDAALIMKALISRQSDKVTGMKMSKVDVHIGALSGAARRVKIRLGTEGDAGIKSKGVLGKLNVAGEFWAFYRDLMFSSELGVIGQVGEVRSLAALSLWYSGVSLSAYATITEAEEELSKLVKYQGSQAQRFETRINTLRKIIADRERASQALDDALKVVSKSKVDDPMDLASSLAAMEGIAGSLKSVAPLMGELNDDQVVGFETVRGARNILQEAQGQNRDLLNYYQIKRSKAMLVFALGEDGLRLSLRALTAIPLAAFADMETRKLRGLATKIGQTSDHLQTMISELGMGAANYFYELKNAGLFPAADDPQGIIHFQRMDLLNDGKEENEAEADDSEIAKDGIIIEDSGTQAAG